jgi:hypothetical protein
MIPRVAFPLGYSAYEIHAKNAKLLAKLAAEDSGNVAEERKRLLLTSTPVDAISARGVPLIGPGSAGGAVVGTRPEQALLAKERRARSASSFGICLTRPTS